MSCEAADIFGVAQVLSTIEPSTEAIQRSVISRAYYAALHAVDARLPAGDRLCSETSHTEIIGRLKRVSNATPPVPGRQKAKQIEKLIATLRRDRTKADYKLGENFKPNIDETLDSAECIMRLCTEITAVPAAAPIAVSSAPAAPAGLRVVR